MLVLLLSEHSVPLLDCVLDKSLEVTWVDSVDDVVEELPVRKFVIKVLIRQVLSEFVVVIDELLDFLDSELLEFGDDDELHLGDLEDLLLVLEEQLQELLVDMRLGRHVVL